MKKVAHNKNNKFIILDDVISSFDANHRKRFADLLIEEYGEYQIILLTHEKHWFKIVQNIIKNKNWYVKTIKYTEEKGTYIDEPSKDLKDRIESKVLSINEENLGSDIRKYLEKVLKNIAVKIEVKVPFKYNDKNEERMSYEMLTYLKATLKKHKCTDILDYPVFDRLFHSIFIGNKDSHDSDYIPNFSDMKSFWLDVQEFEKIFFCNKCTSFVSLRNAFKPNNTISCNCSEIEYQWKL